MNLEINNNLNPIDNSYELSSELHNHIKNHVQYSIDRFEGDFAVCENLSTGEFINISKSEIPIEATKGSILILENGKYVLDSEATKKAQEEIKSIVNNLFKKKK